MHFLSMKLHKYVVYVCWCFWSVGNILQHLETIS